MPKRIIEPEQEEEEISEEEMDEELEEEEQAPRKPIRKLPPLPTRVKPMQPRSPIHKPIKQLQRYRAFAQQQAEGIIDTESEEVIASDIWTALANIIERLERIENSVGSMLNGWKENKNRR